MHETVFESSKSISYVALEKDNFYVAAKEGLKFASNSDKNSRWSWVQIIQDHNIFSIQRNGFSENCNILDKINCKQISNKISKFMIPARR